MIQTMKLDAAMKLLNEAVLLRKANPAKTEEYAERMKAGVVFPPIVFGTWPKSDKYGETGWIDGIHRLGASALCGVKDIAYEIKKFDELTTALAYMYTVNMSHGLPPTEGQRNSRIKLLKQIDPKATLDSLAELFKLGRSSIDRILKDQQSEGASGRKKGEAFRKEDKKPEALKPKPFFASLEKINYTLARVRPTGEIIAYCMPETDKGVELDKDKLATIKDTMKWLSAVLKELS